MDQRGWPRAAIAEGPYATDQGRLALFVASEFEEPQLVPRTKSGVEWLHFAGARLDLNRSGAQTMSGTPLFGPDPPDLMLDGNPPVSVELAQFTNSERRHVLSLLRGVRKAIVAAPLARFAHLTGQLVLIGFEDPRGLPPKLRDEEAIDEVLRGLDKAVAAPVPRLPSENTAPDGFTVQMVNAVLGEGSTACFPLPVLPNSDLAAQRGFDVAAALTLIVRAQDTENELARLTDIHDSTNSDILLISAGAPGRTDGFALVADEIAVEPWIMKTVKMPEPKHLKRILLHRWSHGDVYELFPKYHELAPPRVHGGGPMTVPIAELPASIWHEHCPCGSSKAFQDCHGARAR